MKTDEFLSITDNPNLIPGIYNYCDRWCERCPMTSRCAVFLATPKLDPDDFESEEAFFDAVFENVSDSMQLSVDLLNKFAEEENIDLSESVEDDSRSGLSEATQEEVRQTPISVVAYDYMSLSSVWLEYSGNLIKELEENLQNAALMDLPDRHPEQEVLALRDALEVVSYYLHQIYIKLIRAQTDRKSDDAWFEENDLPKDSDGSAKVALIGIDRSIEAWSTIMPYLPNQEDSMITLLSTLQHLQRLVEESFPDARAFKRPGLDD